MALHAAAPYPECVRTILDAARAFESRLVEKIVAATNAHGQSALDLATRAAAAESVTLLRAAGARTSNSSVSCCAAGNVDTASGIDTPSEVTPPSVDNHDEQRGQTGWRGIAVRVLVRLT